MTESQKAFVETLKKPGILTIMADDGYTYTNYGQCLGKTPASQIRPERQSLLYVPEIYDPANYFKAKFAGTLPDEDII